MSFVLVSAADAHPASLSQKPMNTDEALDVLSFGFTSSPVLPASKKQEVRAVETNMTCMQHPVACPCSNFTPHVLPCAYL